MIAAGDEMVLISSAEELAGIRDSEGSFALVADIDIPEGWVPIENFKGSLDGRGHIIRGLSQGLFARAEGAEIKNFEIEDAKILADGSSSVGLLVGEAVGSQITNIIIRSGIIRAGKGNVGGLAGYLSDCIVEKVFICVEIDTDAEYLGGLVGTAVDTRFYSSGVDEGRLTGMGIVGGFAGRLMDTGLVVGCHSDAKVSGAIAGGFVGQVSGAELPTNANHKIELIECTTMINITMGSESAGGFAGEISFASIVECGAFGDVMGKERSGGFVAGLYDNSRVIYSYGNNGDVHGGKVVGGFVGEMARGVSIEFGYSGGSVRGEGDEEQSVGGFAGVISEDGAPNTITSCLSFAPWVVGQGDVHRFVGRAEHRGVNNCYAMLYSTVVRNGELVHVLSNAYGPDGGDMSVAQVDEIARRIGWRVEGVQ